MVRDQVDRDRQAAEKKARDDRIAAENIARDQRSLQRTERRDNDSAEAATSADTSVGESTLSTPHIDSSKEDDKTPDSQIEDAVRQQLDKLVQNSAELDLLEESSRGVAASIPLPRSREQSVSPEPRFKKEQSVSPVPFLPNTHSTYTAMMSDRSSGLTSVAASNNLILQTRSHLQGAENLETWIENITDIAEMNGLSDCINKNIPKPINPYLKTDGNGKTVEATAGEIALWDNWNAKNSRMRFSIRNSIGETPRLVIKGCTDAREMLDLLCNHYQGTGYHLAANEWNRFLELDLNNFDSVDKFIAEYKSVVVKLAELKITLSDLTHHIQFMKKAAPHLPVWADRHSYQARHGKEDKIIGLQELMADFVDEMRKNGGVDEHGSALYGNKTRGVGQGGSKAGKGKNKGQSDKSKNELAKVKCQHCGHPSVPKAHLKRCLFNPSNAKDKKSWEEKHGTKWLNYSDYTKSVEKKKNEGKSANFGMGRPTACSLLPFHFSLPRPPPSAANAFEPSIENVLDTVKIAGVEKDESGKPVALRHDDEWSDCMRSIWIYDTGASSHCTWDKNDFTDYRILSDKEARSLALMSAKGLITPVGAGTVILECTMPDESINPMTLLKSLHFPELPAKLFSGSKLWKKGGHAEPGANDGMGMAYDRDRNPLFQVDDFMVIQTLGLKKVHCALPVLPPTALSSSKTMEVWHRRFGHLSPDNVKATQKVVSGLPEEDLAKYSKEDAKVCEPCELGKSHRTRRKNVSHHATKPFERMNVDVVKIHPIGLNGHEWATLFTDEATRERTVFTHKEKGGARKATQLITKRMQTQHGVKIKSWRLDGGNEYGGSDLHRLIEDSGSFLELTTPFAPDQDGISERSIRAILEKLRPIFIEMNVPLTLWPELIRGMTHIMNRTTTRALPGGITPYEAYMNHVRPGIDNRPDVSHLRVLGSIAYVHIPKERRIASNKFAPRAEKGVLVGFEGNHIYRVWVPTRARNKIVRSSSVRFNELGFITDSDDNNDGSHVRQSTGDGDDDTIDLTPMDGFTYVQPMKSLQMSTEIPMQLTNSMRWTTMRTSSIKPM